VPVDPKTLTVCSSCGQRSCWQGEYMCDNAKAAGTCTLAEFEERQELREAEEQVR